MQTCNALSLRITTVHYSNLYTIQGQSLQWSLLFSLPWPASALSSIAMDCWLHVCQTWSISTAAYALATFENFSWHVSQQPCRDGAAALGSLHAGLTQAMALQSVFDAEFATQSVQF